MRPKRGARGALGVWLPLVLVAVLVLRALAPGLGQETISYTRFLDLVAQGQVTEVTIGEGELEGIYMDRRMEIRFRTTRPPELDAAPLVEELLDNDVDVSGEQPGLLQSLVLSWVLPLLLLALVWIFLFRRLGRGGGPVMSFGRSKHKVYDRTDLKTSFADVAGVDEAVEELREIVDFLRRPDVYRRLGAKLPKGVLLVGPPGTGKTLLARAVAGEADVPFFFIAASEFVELFVGVGAARVRDLFQQAKQNAPCLIFIDELDTIGRSRSGGPSGAGTHEEREQTLNQLLTEMDGFDASTGVLIVAATNRPEVLDPALRRPGRFDRQVVVDLPDRAGRAAILRVHTRRVRLGPDVELETVAARTPGASGADLENVVNEAALLATRRGKAVVAQDEFEEAVDRVSLGLERRSRVLRPEERERVAHHELGHALVALARPHADRVHRVSIVPRGAAALGVTQQLPAEDRHILTRPELEDRLAVMMGGRAAELVVYGDTSTGAHSDLQQATALARRMVHEFGMSERIGPVALGRPPFPPGTVVEHVSDRLVAEADAEVRGLLDEAEARAVEVLDGHRERLPGLAELLLARETISGDELQAALIAPPRPALRAV